MPAVIFAMLVILVLAVVVIAIVVIGMEGTGSHQHPEFADALARTARHLNGEAEPPQGLVAFVGEIDEMSVPDIKAVPAKLRSMRSARSASSASSASMPEPPVIGAPPTVGKASENKRPMIKSTVYSPVGDNPEAVTWTPPNPDAAAEFGPQGMPVPASEPLAGGDTTVHRPVTSD